MINVKSSAEAFAQNKVKLSRKELAAELPVGKASVSKRSKQSNGATRPAAAPKRNGLTVPRVFSKAGVNPFDEIEWDRRMAEITDDSGKSIFKQDNVEVPKNWSLLATKVVVSKYFYGENGTSEREYSARQMVHRVTRTIADWGKEQGYFATEKDGETFYNELTWLCINQYGSFNSPVWFNCGLHHVYGVGKKSGAGSYFFDPQMKSIQRSPSQYEHPPAPTP